MTSRTGKPRAPLTGSLRGFTLIEILLVIVLLSIAATIAAPRFRTAWDRVQHEQSIERLKQTLQYARNRAAIDDRIYRFVIDPYARAYHLEVGSSGDPSSPVIFRRELSSRGRGKRIAGVIDVSMSPPEILFFPSGASTGGRIELSHDAKDKTAIEVTAVTGHISIHEEER
jgi:general secretion pathway protein H